MPNNITIQKVDFVVVDSLKNSTIKTEINATIIHTGDNGDLPIPETDKFTFKFTPVIKGQVKPASGTSFDVDIVADQTDPNKFYARIEVIGIAYGTCRVTGSKAGSSAWSSNSASFEVIPTTEIPKITTQPAPALQTSVNAGKFGDPENLITKIVVLVMDKDENPVPATDVTFTIKNVRTNPTKQSGVFYNNQGKVQSVTPLKPKNEKSDATTAQKTDENGYATLNIGTNNNPGHLKILVSTRSSIGETAFIYIYDTGSGTEIDAPVTDIGSDLTQYKKETFPVNVTNYNVEDNEFIGVFLNDKYQTQVKGVDINQNDSELLIDLDTDELIIGIKDDKFFNNTFYARRTSKGDLINSKSFYYKANGPLPDPEPTNQILEYMIDPNGGAINLGSIYVDGNATDFITTIDLAEAAKTLSDKMQYVLKPQDTITIYATFQGDYESDDMFQKNSFKYQKSVTDPNDSAFHITIPARDIKGYGTSKEAGKHNIYAMYYNVTPQNERKPIASSQFVRGVLSTRII